MPRLLATLFLWALLVVVSCGRPTISADPTSAATSSFSDSTTYNAARAQDPARWPPNLTVTAEEDPGVRHSRLQLIWGLVGEIWGWAVLATILFTGLSPRIEQVAAHLFHNRLGTLVPFVALLSLVLSLIGLPIAYYRGFVIEHEFGLSNQTLFAWLSDYGKSFGLALAGNLILFGLVYLFIRRYSNRWWLYSAILVIVFSVIIAGLAPVVISPLFNKFEPIQDQGLRQRIMTLACNGGVEVADVLQTDMSRQTKAANAYFTGIGPTKRIVLGDNLLANFTDDEILTVVAHEMGHQVHNDLWRGLGAGAILFLVGFYVLHRSARLLVSRFGARFGFKTLADSASLPLLLLLFGIISFLMGPVQNAFSRYIEHEADAYAIELTGKNEAYASALQKLGVVNVADPNPPEWIEFVFYSHPSLKKRIEFAQGYNRMSSAPRAFLGTDSSRHTR